MKRVVSSMMMVLLLAGAAQAATYVWTGSVSTNFSDAANWLVDGEVPATPPINSDGGTATSAGAADTVVLPAAVTANMPALTSPSWSLLMLQIDAPGWVFSTGTNILKVGRFGGVVTTYASGTSTFTGNLMLGSRDTAGPGWTIGMLWLPGKAVCYGNGVEIGRWESDRVCSVQSYPILYMVSGGWANVPLDPSKLPADFVIDYIRVQQFAIWPISFAAACSESPPYLVDSPFGGDFGVGRDLRARRFPGSRPYCELLIRVWQRADLASPEDGPKTNDGAPKSQY